MDTSPEALLESLNESFRFYEKKCGQLLSTRRVNDSLSTHRDLPRDDLIIIFYEMRTNVMEIIQSMFQSCEDKPDRTSRLAKVIEENGKKYKQITMLLQMKAVLNHKIKM